MDEEIETDRDDSTSRDEDKPRVSDASILEDAKEAFELVKETEEDNRRTAAEDLRFARLGEQWPQPIKTQREIDGRPVLTNNRMPAFIRQVVNDARQNKPSIKVHPVGTGSDQDTAEVMSGLIRNIEYASNAEVAYDTATESAVTMGWGYFKIDIDYAHDDTFEQDITIERVADTFSIYGDPYSKAADSSDWNSAFETQWLTKDEFKDEFPDAEDPQDWTDDAAKDWVKNDDVLVATWWRREEVRRTVYLLRTPSGEEIVVSEDEANEPAFPDTEEFGEITNLEWFEAQGGQVLRDRETRTWKVTRHILTGGEVLKTEEWPGKFIPIIPVYGDEVIDEEGKRILRSLICDAKDAQRAFNYWRSTATELVALAPRTPFIGPKGAFASDAKNWSVINTENLPYVEYDPVPGAPNGGAPQRQPLDTGAAAGALQEAANAADDMKSIIGIYDPALGQRSNETSGTAIRARQRESDVGTYHFQDNMSRAIRHAGRILLDLIPKVYTDQRVIRIIGEDGEDDTVPLGRPVPVTDRQGNPETQQVMGPNGQPVPDPQSPDKPLMQKVTRIYDLTAGRYDLTVSSGPSYSTRREEAADQMTEFVRAFPQAAPVIGDLLAKNLDWPGADEIADRLHMLLPQQLRGGLPPEVEQTIEQGKQQIAAQQEQMDQMRRYIARLEDDKRIDQQKAETDRFEAETDARRENFEAETDRIKALGSLQDAKYHQTDVPDRGNGPYSDFDGLKREAETSLAQARAEEGWSSADMARIRAAREATQGLRPPQNLGFAPTQNPVPPQGPQNTGQ